MKRTKFAIVLAIALTVVACGGDTATTTTDPAPTTAAAETTTSPAETTTTVAETTTEAPSEEISFVGADDVESVITDTSRIVSLAGDITEIIFELGLGDQVAAIDITTTYPDDAAALPAIGFGQQLAAEPVLAFQPTLVIGDETTEPTEAVEQLRAAGVPVVILPSQTTLEGVTEKIRTIATILSAEDAGEELVERVEADVAEAQSLIPDVDSPPRVAYVYVRGEQLVLIFGQGIATNAMITGAGAVDAGAASGVFGAAPLTPEAIVAAAPDVIVLPDAGLAALGGEAAFAQLPGIGETPAGQTEAFLAYDEAFFFNLGPRVGEALEQFVIDLYGLTGE
jgi:iron complex transport system substrate-binding protein